MGIISKILKMNVNVTCLNDVANLIIKRCFTYSDPIKYVCVSNVHMCMESFDSNNYQKVINKANIVVPDGKPLVWAQKLLGYSKARQVRGTDLTLELCRRANEQKVPVGFFGGTQETLNQLVINLKQKYEKLTVAYSYSPPFRPLTPLEDRKVIGKINSSDIKILFVGIGCPKQEYWMEEHSKDLKCIMIGVGAAFDFISGNKKKAPRWIQTIGLEWLFRLFSEPKRLSKRYFKNNPRFIWYFTKQLFGNKYD